MVIWISSASRVRFLWLDVFNEVKARSHPALGPPWGSPCSKLGIHKFTSLDDISELWKVW